MEVKLRKGMIVLKMPLISPIRKSKSGKTLIVATSLGPRRTRLKVNGKRVIAIASAWIRPDKPVKSEKGKSTSADRPIARKVGKPSFKTRGR